MCPVAGAGSDAADADGVATIEIQGKGVFSGSVASDLFTILFPDGGNVGVTVKADTGLLLCEVLFRQAVVDDVSKGRRLLACLMDHR